MILQQGENTVVNIVVDDAHTNLRERLPLLARLFEFSVQNVLRRGKLRSFLEIPGRIPPLALQALSVEAKIGLVKAVLQRWTLCQNAPDPSPVLNVDDIVYMGRQSLAEMPEHRVVKIHIRRRTGFVAFLDELRVSIAFHADDVCGQTMNERLSNIHDNYTSFLLL